MFEVGIGLFRNVGLLAFIAVAYSIIPREPRLIPRQVLLGLLFGCGAILSMLDPVVIGPGLLVDLRTTMIMLAGYFGGPVACLLSAAMAGVYRAHLGGMGAPVGELGILIAATIGLVGYFFLRPKSRASCWPALAIFALLAPLPAIAVFALPWDIAVQALSESVAPSSLVRVFGVLLLGTIMIHEDQRFAAERRVAELAVTDELSGLANRRKFYAALDDEEKRAARYNAPFCVLLIDIDRFKSINDTYGHAIGDEVIRRLAQVLERTHRRADLPARIGGEEFAVLLTNSDREAAAKLGERIRAEVEQEVVSTSRGDIRFTISVGVGSNAKPASSIDTVMSIADGALYAAKQGGRNQVALA